MKKLRSVFIVFFVVLASCVMPMKRELNSNRSFSKCDDPEKCIYQLIDIVSNNWFYPHDSVYGLQAIIRIELDLDGFVQDVSIVESSGDIDVDKSVIDAVKNSSPFVEITGLHPDVFEKYFKAIRFKFNPTKT